MDAHLDIGQVARLTGLAPSALRYYEELGLIASSARRGLRRVYDLTMVDRLGLIMAVKAAGFSLTELRELFDARADDRRVRSALAAKADELGDRIRQLEALRDGLLHAVNCQHPSLYECPVLADHVRRRLRVESPVGETLASRERALRG